MDLLQTTPFPGHRFVIDFRLLVKAIVCLCSNGRSVSLQCHIHGDVVEQLFQVDALAYHIIFLHGFSLKSSKGPQQIPPPVPFKKLSNLCLFQTPGATFISSQWCLFWKTRPGGLNHFYPVDFSCSIEDGGLAPFLFINQQKFGRLAHFEWFIAHSCFKKKQSSRTEILGHPFSVFFLSPFLVLICVNSWIIPITPSISLGQMPRHLGYFSVSLPWGCR
jgi:hypothetical protein